MRKTLEFASPVPIVGQAITVHEGIAMATFTCRCRTTNAPILIPHVDVIKICPHCRHMYALVAFEFNRDKGQSAPLVSVRDLGAQGQLSGPPGADPSGN